MASRASAHAGAQAPNQSGARVVVAGVCFQTHRRRPRGGRRAEPPLRPFSGGGAIIVGFIALGSAFGPSAFEGPLRRSARFAVGKKRRGAAFDFHGVRAPFGGSLRRRRRRRRRRRPLRRLDAGALSLVVLLVLIILVVVLAFRARVASRVLRALVRLFFRSEGLNGRPSIASGVPPRRRRGDAPPSRPSRRRRRRRRRGGGGGGATGRRAGLLSSALLPDPDDVDRPSRREPVAPAFAWRHRPLRHRRRRLLERDSAVATAAAGLTTSTMRPSPPTAAACSAAAPSTSGAPFGAGVLGLTRTARPTSAAARASTSSAALFRSRSGRSRGPRARLGPCAGGARRHPPTCGASPAFSRASRRRRPVPSSARPCAGSGPLEMNAVPVQPVPERGLYFIEHWLDIVFAARDASLHVLSRFVLRRVIELAPPGPPPDARLPLLRLAHPGVPFPAAAPQLLAAAAPRAEPRIMLSRGRNTPSRYLQSTFTSGRSESGAAGTGASKGFFETRGGLFAGDAVAAAFAGPTAARRVARRRFRRGRVQVRRPSPFPLRHRFPYPSDHPSGHPSAGHPSAQKTPRERSASLAGLDVAAEERGFRRPPPRDSRAVPPRAETGPVPSRPPREPRRSRDVRVVNELVALFRV